MSSFMFSWVPRPTSWSRVEPTTAVLGRWCIVLVPDIRGWGLTNSQIWDMFTGKRDWYNVHTCMLIYNIYIYTYDHIYIYIIICIILYIYHTHWMKILCKWRFNGGFGASLWRQSNGCRKIRCGCPSDRLQSIHIDLC